MKTGEKFEASVETNRGDWQDPYSADQLVEKYMSLAGRLWPEAYCEEVISQIQNAEQLPDFMTIFKSTKIGAMDLPTSPAPGQGNAP